MTNALALAGVLLLAAMAPGPDFLTVLRGFLTAAKVRRAIDAVMGTLLVAIGVRIAVSN
jgi:threonine/homoserine/homoserine lactone efflux protein